VFATPKIILELPGSIHEVLDSVAVRADQFQIGHMVVAPVAIDVVQFEHLRKLLPTAALTGGAPFEKVFLRFSVIGPDTTRSAGRFAFSTYIAASTAIRAIALITLATSLRITAALTGYCRKVWQCLFVPIPRGTCALFRTEPSFYGSRRSAIRLPAQFAFANHVRSFLRLRAGSFVETVDRAVSGWIAGYALKALTASSACSNFFLSPQDTSAIWRTRLTAQRAITGELLVAYGACAGVFHKGEY
jgi:hypothetical protein